MLRIAAYIMLLGRKARCHQVRNDYEYTMTFFGCQGVKMEKDRNAHLKYLFIVV